MKTFLLTTVLIATSISYLVAQSNAHEAEIKKLIDQYASARATKNADELKNILVSEVDQLVSTGEWRRGLDESLSGMMRSSTRRPGSRSLTVENIRLINSGCAIADARYVIDNEDGTQRKMWSTFVTVMQGDNWKIAAIRNMLPAK